MGTAGGRSVLPGGDAVELGEDGLGELARDAREGVGDGRLVVVAGEGAVDGADGLAVDVRLARLRVEGVELGGEDDVVFVRLDVVVAAVADGLRADARDRGLDAEARLVVARRGEGAVLDERVEQLLRGDGPGHRVGRPVLEGGHVDAPQRLGHGRAQAVARASREQGKEGKGEKGGACHGVCSWGCGLALRLWTAPLAGARAARRARISSACGASGKSRRKAW